MSVPRWSPGDCILRDVQSDGVILRCERDVWHERPLPVSGERSIETQTHGSSQMRQGRHRNFFIKDPTSYTVRPDEHEPCPDCHGKRQVLIATKREAGRNHWYDCATCEGSGIVHDRWCGCNPPLSMLGVGSVLRSTDPLVIYDYAVFRAAPSEPGSVVAIESGGTHVPIYKRDISREGGWWVARWVPPSHDNETDRP